MKKYQYLILVKQEVTVFADTDDEAVEKAHNQSPDCEVEIIDKQPISKDE